MKSEDRVQVTRFLAGVYLLGIFLAVANTIFNNAAFDTGNVVALIVITFAFFMSMGFVWSWGDLASESSETHASKRKREQRVEDLLDELDETEMEVLRQRLADEAMFTETEMYLTSDGELVERRTE